MKSKYQLETLLDIRRQEADDAGARHARAIQELERRKQDLIELEDTRAGLLSRFDDEQESLDASSSEVVDLQAMQNFDEYRRGTDVEVAMLGEQIESAHERIREQERAVEQARQVLAKAEAALTAVEKHREKWDEEQRLLERRKEASELDEIAARRWREENE